MTNFIHRTHDITTGEITEIPYTSEEIAIAEAGLAKAKELDAEREKVQADKAALLVKLGISADEAKLLLA